MKIKQPSIVINILSAYFTGTFGHQQNRVRNYTVSDTNAALAISELDR